MLMKLLGILGAAPKKSSEEPKQVEEERKVRDDRMGMECGMCNKDTIWIKQKGEAKYDTFKCDLCQKSFEYPSRFHCPTHKFDMCAKCSKVCTKEKCGCGNKLEYDTDLDRYCNWCGSKSEKGWKCSDCKYLVCSDCRPYCSPVKKEPVIPSPVKNSPSSSPSKDKYEKGEQIGKGGFGKVYKCKDKTDSVRMFISRFTR